MFKVRLIMLCSYCTSYLGLLEERIMLFSFKKLLDRPVCLMSGLEVVGHVSVEVLSLNYPEESHGSYHSG